MHPIQIADQGFVAAAPAVVAPLLADKRKWRQWFPDLTLLVREDRGHQGIRWNVRGGVEGTGEIWLEPVLDGTMIHFFLHGAPTAQSGSAADLARAVRRHREAAKRVMWWVKRVAESGRAAGEPAA